jgi:hypothetical protein
MKTIEITKNIIILFLIAVIGGMALYYNFNDIMPPDEEKAVVDEVYPTIKPRTTYSHESPIQELNRSCGILTDSIVKLKKKLNYYYEYYRKNQPVNVKVGVDKIMFDTVNSNSSAGVFYYEQDTSHNIKTTLPHKDFIVIENKKYIIDCDSVGDCKIKLIVE